MYIGEKFKQSFERANVVLWAPETLYFGMLVLKRCELEREQAFKCYQYEWSKYFRKVRLEFTCNYKSSETPKKKKIYQCEYDFITPNKDAMTLDSSVYPVVVRLK